MANEATLTVGLTIRKGPLQVFRQVTYQMDVANGFGPTPGALTVPTAGLHVDLSALTTPGHCWLTNLDTTNFVAVGLYDVETDRYYPLIELPPASAAGPKAFEVYLHREVGTEYAGTGTGTTARTNRLHLKADGAACDVIVEAFDR